MTPKVNITQAAQRISVSVNGAGEVNVAVTPPPDVVVQVSQGAVSVTYVGGDVFGPASSTNNALAVFDGTDGKLLKNGTLTNPAANRLGGVSTVTAQGSGGIVVEASNGTDIGMLGAGNTANATWYGNHNFNAVTADRIAGFGGSKTLQSLDTATYPSLTELSYVKGVTSGIQAQINLKPNFNPGNPGEILFIGGGNTFDPLPGSGASGNSLSIEGSLSAGLFLGKAGGLAAVGSMDISPGVDDLGGQGGNGGEIDLSGGDADSLAGGGSAGSLLMGGQDAASGGADAGSINTTGTGSIELGYGGTRTTIEGSAASDYTIVLPSSPGNVGDYLKIDSIVGTTVNLVFAP